MNIQPIRSDEDLQRALARLEQLWATPPGTPEADELEVLTILIERYEDLSHAIPASDPIEAIKFRMEQQGLTPKDMVIPIAMQVPRKSELFQDDIFPDTYAGVPTSTVAQ